MELYKPVNVNCANLLKSITAAYMLDNACSVAKIPLEESVLNIVNAEFNSKGISNIVSPLAFKRNNTSHSTKECHVDGDLGNVRNASIVIPVSGCVNTFQYWYNGDYSLVPIIDKQNISRYIINWKTSALAGKAHIVDTPMLCRVDIPHGAVANGNDYRITCTIRFKDNESFEELYEKLMLS